MREDERKLAKLDRLADGQFSCDTGLSGPVVCSSQSGWTGLRTHRLLGDGSLRCRSFFSRSAFHPGALLERAGIDNESDQVP